MTACWVDHPFPPPAARHALAATPRPPTRPLAIAGTGRLARIARRLVAALLGTVAILAGVAMLVLPGPGLVTIALGFGILGREYAWAARVSAAIRARLAATTTTVRDALRRP